MTNKTDDMRAYKREWYAAQRSAFFQDKACAWCGSTYRMELHHLDKSTKEGHCIWSWSKERREAEIAKCIVLCLKCHRGYHAQEKRKPLVHGTYNAYAAHRCRCDICRKGNTERAQKHNLRRQARRSTARVTARAQK